MQVVVSTKAKADLVSIAEYVARENVNAAHELIAHITNTFISLAESPNRGRPGRVTGTRELVVAKSYIVAYRVNKQQVTILTVRHAARLWPESL